MVKEFTSVVNSLAEGKVGILPTDTVYGLVCVASNKEAAQRLYGLKSRDKNPGTIIAANIEQIAELGIKIRYLKAVENFWPNPVSIIIPCGPDLSYLHLGKMSLAVRIPADKDLTNLLANAGPLLTTSANHPGEPPANTVQEAKKYFGGEVDFYVDGGNLSGNKPSTIIRVVDDIVEVLREGAVKIDENGRIVS